MSQPFSLRIFVADGDPDGLREDGDGERPDIGNGEPIGRRPVVREVETEVDANLKRAQALRQAVVARAFVGSH